MVVVSLSCTPAPVMHAGFFLLLWRCAQISLSYAAVYLIKMVIFNLLCPMFSLQILFAERRMRPGGIKLFRTQSPRHFEGGDWDQGGSCPRLQPLLPEKVSHIRTMSLNLIVC